MRLKQGFILEDIFGKTIGVTTGEAARTFSGMVQGNPVAELALKTLAERDISEQELIDVIESEFDAPRERIAADLKPWLDSLRKRSLLDE